MNATTFTPLEFEILLHYMVRPEAHRMQLENPPCWPEVRDRLLTLEVLEILPAHDSRARFGAAYATTERGIAYIEAALSLPLPVKKWVIP